MIWADLDDIPHSEGAPVMVLDPDDIELAGNVSAHFQPLATAPF